MCTLCVCAHACVHTCTGRTRSGSVSSLDLGTRNCSSRTEAQTLISPWPCTSLGQLEHSLRGSVGVSTLLKFLCHLAVSSWLNPDSAANRVWGTQSTPLRLISPSPHPGPGGPVTPGHPRGCSLRTLFLVLSNTFFCLQHLFLHKLYAQNQRKAFLSPQRQKISRTVMHPGL